MEDNFVAIVANNILHYKELHEMYWGWGHSIENGM